MGKAFSRRTIQVIDPADDSEWVAYTWTITHPTGFVEHKIEAVYVADKRANKAIRVQWTDVSKEVKNEICAGLDERFQPELLDLQDDDETLSEGSNG